jgi:hypothetical protein
LLSSVSALAASSNNPHTKPPPPPSTIVDSKGAYVASLLGTNDLARLVNGTWVKIDSPFQPEAGFLLYPSKYLYPRYASSDCSGAAYITAPSTPRPGYVASQTGGVWGTSGTLYYAGDPVSFMSVQSERQPDGSCVTFSGFSDWFGPLTGVQIGPFSLPFTLE